MGGQLGRDAFESPDVSSLAAGPLGTCNCAMKNQSMNEFEGDRLISKREAAGILGVCIRTVERAVSAGELSIRRIRGCVRLLLSEVLRFGGLQ